MDKKGFFSIELKSKAYLEKMDIANKPHEVVLVEGFLGEYTEIEHIENTILKFEGVNGVLRLDLCNDAILLQFANGKDSRGN